MKVKSESEVTQLCPTLCDPMDCSPPGSSVHGIFQARVLEWGAIAFSDLSAYHGIITVSNFFRGYVRNLELWQMIVFFKLIYLILTTTLSWKCDPNPHLTHEKTKAESFKVYLRLTTCKCWN